MLRSPITYLLLASMALLLIAVTCPTRSPQSLAGPQESTAPAPPVEVVPRYPRTVPEVVFSEAPSLPRKGSPLDPFLRALLGKRDLRYVDFGAEPDLLIEFALRFRADPQAVFPELVRCYRQADQLRARMLIGLVMMSVRTVGEPFVLEELRTADEYLEKLELSRLLWMPADMFPVDEAVRRKLWHDCVWNLRVLESQIEGFKRGGGLVELLKTPPEEQAENARWEALGKWMGPPEGWASPEAVRLIEEMGPRETDDWLQMNMYHLLITAAKGGDRGVGLWALDQLRAAKWGNAVGPLFDAMFHGLGPEEGTRETLRFIEREGTVGDIVPADPNDDQMQNWMFMFLGGAGQGKSWEQIEQFYRTRMDEETQGRLIGYYLSYARKYTPGGDRTPYGPTPQAPEHIKTFLLKEMRSGKKGYFGTLAEHYLGDEDVRALVRSFMTDSDAAYRGRAAYYAGLAHMEDLKPALVRMAREAEDPAEWRRACDALRQMDFQMGVEIERMRDAMQTPEAIPDNLGQ